MPPRLGSRREILTEVGYSEADIDALLGANAIGEAAPRSGKAITYGRKSRSGWRFEKARSHCVRDDTIVGIGAGASMKEMSVIAGG